LACELKDSYCNEQIDEDVISSNNCCEDGNGNNGATGGTKIPFPDFYTSPKFYKEVKAALQDTYYYISVDLIQEASKKGISRELETKLRNFLIVKSKICYCEEEIKEYDNIVSGKVWRNKFSHSDRSILFEWFKPRKAFKINFSGEKEWIEPNLPSNITVSPVLLFGNKFLLKINAVLEIDKPAVTFYDKDKQKIKEDFNTTLPLVKIELDDKIKLVLNDKVLNSKILKKDGVIDECCLLKKSPGLDHFISLYHFFRNVIVIGELSNNPSDATRIDVTVCGLKNFIVQNDESLQDVNAPIYPFGTRPEIVDFNIVNPVPNPQNLRGPNFFIGSQEIFCKKWNDVFININWKDKPKSFNEYYKAYWVDPTNNTKFGLYIKDFEINLAVLEEGKWKKELLHPPPPPIGINTKAHAITLDNNRELFKNDGSSPNCTQLNSFEQTITIKNNFFGLNQQFRIINDKLVKYEVNTLNGFLKINLQNQDFLHKDYSFVLARQMMAFGKLPSEHVEGAVYYDSTIPGGGPIVISTSNMLNALNNSGPIAHQVNLDVQGINVKAGLDVPPHNITALESSDIRGILRVPNIPPGTLSLNVGANTLDNLINNDVLPILNNLKKYAAIIPNEPWTPIISLIALDYTATATITDIDLIHLYPYTDTYKHEEIELQPTLFPVFCDEGTLFLGLKDLEPGSNVNMLFQLAEASANSESERDEVRWHYLDNNKWKRLREGFEVLKDATDGLTTSGIIKFVLPENMTNENTILPKGLHWIKASIPKNSRSVCETVSIFTQAILAKFTNDSLNDKHRLSKPLVAKSITKLQVADANVKKLDQPFDSFGGRVPEAEGHFYVRVSELLRHKGRSIQKFDYERLALEAYPEIFKAKCINHSFALDANKYFNDFPISPGYVILAVIPDLNKLKAAKSFEPRVPVSMLENLQEYLKKRSSPFARIRIMNPRYEKINFCLKVKLNPGKDENYYKEKMKQDLSEFMAPWAVGDYEKLRFGQCVNRSDIIRFLESKDYLDYIIELKMGHEFEKDTNGDSILLANRLEICPKTPRSILIAGDIDICILQKDCDDWNKKNICGNIAEPIVDYCNEDKIAK